MKEKRKVTIHVGNGSPMAAQHFNRNSLCRCGSGKKTKHCCGTKAKFFYTKSPAKNADNQNKDITNDQV